MRGSGGRREPAAVIPVSHEWPATPMISFRLRSFALLISALGVLAGPASAQRDETDTTGGTFTTPGYPTRNGQFPSANPALQGGAGNPQLQGQSPRPATSPNGIANDPR